MISFLIERNSDLVDRVLASYGGRREWIIIKCLLGLLLQSWFCVRVGIYHFFYGFSCRLSEMFIIRYSQKKRLCMKERLLTKEPLMLRVDWRYVSFRSDP
jgi:hypothetical protein